MKPDSEHIKKYLTNYYQQKSGWIVIPELRMGTGYNNSEPTYITKPNDIDCERSIDLFAFNCYRSNGFIRIAFEIKISSNDFCRELSNPLKRRAAVRFSNLYYFVTLGSLINPQRIPDDTGLIEIGNEYKRHNIIVKAPWHDNAPTWSFMASVARTLKKSEGICEL